MLSPDIVMDRILRFLGHDPALRAPAAAAVTSGTSSLGNALVGETAAAQQQQLVIRWPPANASSFSGRGGSRGGSEGGGRAGGSSSGIGFEPRKGLGKEIDAAFRAKKTSGWSLPDR